MENSAPMICGMKIMTLWINLEFSWVLCVYSVVVCHSLCPFLISLYSFLNIVSCFQSDERLFTDRILSYIDESDPEDPVYMSCTFEFLEMTVVTPNRFDFVYQVFHILRDANGSLSTRSTSRIWSSGVPAHCRYWPVCFCIINHYFEYPSCCRLCRHVAFLQKSILRHDALCWWINTRNCGWRWGERSEWQHRYRVHFGQWRYVLLQYMSCLLIQIAIECWYEHLGSPGAYRGQQLPLRGTDNEFLKY